MRTRIAIGVALAGAALFGAIAVGYSNAQSGGEDFSKSEEDAIRDIVRDYLLNNPEVLIESLNAYAEQERALANERAKQSVRENLSALLDENHGVIVGKNPAGASVAVVEFFDYHCGFCKRASGFVKELTKEDPAVKVVFREFPILRPESDYASEYVFASRTQGKYAQFHFAMMDEKGVMTKERVKALAKKVGVDNEMIETELKRPMVKEAIGDSHRLAIELGIDGTPAFIIASLNGEFVDIVQGNRQEDITAAIAEAKKAAKK